MNKFLIFLLVLLLLLTYPGYFPVNPVTAEANTGSGAKLNNTRVLTGLAKGFAAIYLLSKLNNLITDQQQNNQDELSSARSSSRLDDKIIVIDPGHGGHDPGAVGSGGLKEKSVNLAIGLKLFNLLQQNTGARVYLTREDDRFIPLHERAALANRLKADIFISIHSNADKKGVEKGIETYAHFSAPRNTWALAWYLHESLVNELLLVDRGLKADSFHVIRETANIKSVLLEIGFISHYEEELLLNKSDFRKKAARAIYNGLLNYYLE